MTLHRPRKKRKSKKREESLSKPKGAPRARTPKSLVQFFRESPLFGLELNFERDRDPGRDIEFDP